MAWRIRDISSARASGERGTPHISLTAMSILEPNQVVLSDDMREDICYRINSSNASWVNVISIRLFISWAKANLCDTPIFLFKFLTRQSEIFWLAILVSDIILGIAYSLKVLARVFILLPTAWIPPDPGDFSSESNILSATTLSCRRGPRVIFIWPIVALRSLLSWLPRNFS